MAPGSGSVKHREATFSHQGVVYDNQIYRVGCILEPYRIQGIVQVQSKVINHE